MLIIVNAILPWTAKIKARLPYDTILFKLHDSSIQFNVATVTDMENTTFATKRFQYIKKVAHSYCLVLKISHTVLNRFYGCKCCTQF